MDIKEFFFFNKFVTPKVITFFYWLALLGVVGSGLFQAFVGDGFVGFVSGIFTIVFGVVVVRVSFELTMVLFNINRNLEEINQRQGKL